MDHILGRAKRRCYIHIGTHKTGTTSLQDTLTRSEAMLARAGVLVVRTGRPVELAGSPYVGNQNLAWELVSDARFDATFGTLADLEHELASSPYRDAIVTSEDFVLAYDRPEKLEALRATCVRAGYVPKVIVYLRDQATYAQSLYAMFVARGKLAIGFDRFCTYIFELGEIGWSRNRFPFDYNVLLESFAAYFGREHIIARAFHRDEPTAALASEFVSLFDSDQPIDPKALIVSPRLNEAGSLLAVLEALYENCRATRHDLVHPLRIASELGIAEHRLRDHPYVALGAREAKAFDARFADSNVRVAANFGTRIERFAPADSIEHRRHLAFIRACANAWGADVAA